MFLNSIFLAFCVSIDSLSIGLTYGVRNLKITFNAKVVLFIVSVFITTFSTILGFFICKIFSINFSNIIACLLLCLMGFWMILQAITSKKEKVKKEYSFFIKFLGITVQIIKDPNYSDLNKSNKIETKEAIYLGTALSLDSFGIGIGGSIIGLNTFLFPFLVASFQLLFITIGTYLGNKIKNISNIPENIWSILSGTLLILIGLSKIAF